MPDTDKPLHQGTPKRRAYKDRLGRVITDPATIEGRHVMEHLRRCQNRVAKAGGSFPTVAQVAHSAGVSAEAVVAIIREFGSSWLMGLVENDGPMAGWEAYQDGE